MKNVDNDEKDKALKLLRVYLLNMQRETLAFSAKISTEINGLVFEIDRVIPREKKKEE